MTHDPREALVAWRASTGYSQTEVGALFGVTKQGVGNWETGRASVPQRVQARLRREGWLPALPRGSQRKRPALNHDPLCPPTSLCRSCRSRRSYSYRHDRWTPAEEALLVSLAGTIPVVAIGPRLEAAHGSPRTPGAVQRRLHHLGVSGFCGGLGASTIAYYCGVAHSTVTQWIARRWLHATRFRDGQSPWLFTDAQFEAFLREHYAVLQWRQMPASRWRDFVELLWRRDPLYPTPEVARMLGVQPRIVRFWVQRGILAAQWVNGVGQGRQGYRIRRSVLARFQPPRERTA